MTLPKNVAELQGENVLFELECIDRMYLNLYVPQLASAPGVAAYFRGYKGHRFASTKEAVAMSEGFRRQVLDFAERKATPIIRFEKGMRKDDVMHKRLHDPLGNYARPASAAGDSRPAHFARKDQLHRFWSAQIDVLPDDFLEKLPPVPRTIPNLREGKLRLQHRKPVAKAGLSVCRWIG